MNLKRKRPSAPCNDRETVYKTMAQWRFAEVNKVNFNLLDWIEKSTPMFKPTLTESFGPADGVSPQEFLEILAADKGLLLERLAICLGSPKTRMNRHRESYEVFHEFARNDAKLAHGCIFLLEELFGNTYEDYKSVFYTLYKLANQARDKFGMPTMLETQGMSWSELGKKKWEEREKCARRKELYEEMATWSFDEVNEKNQQIMEWLHRHQPSAADGGSFESGISPKEFLEEFSGKGRIILGKTTHRLLFLGDRFYYEFYVLIKDRLPNECIFWENELYGNNYEDYKSVFCTFYMLMRLPANSINIDPIASNNSVSYSQHPIPTNSNGNFTIYVQMDAKKLKLSNCYAEQTIWEIKKMIKDREGIFPEYQRLVFEQKRLMDHCQLADYDIQSGSTIQYYLYMIGC